MEEPSALYMRDEGRRQAQVIRLKKKKKIFSTPRFLQKSNGPFTKASGQRAQHHDSHADQQRGTIALFFLSLSPPITTPPHSLPPSPPSLLSVCSCETRKARKNRKRKPPQTDLRYARCTGTNGEAIPRHPCGRFENPAVQTLCSKTEGHHYIHSRAEADR